MKKFVALIVFALLAVGLMAQTRVVKTISVASSTAKFNTQLEAGDLVVDRGTGNIYCLTDISGVNKTIATQVAAGKAYRYGYVSDDATFDSTLTVGTDLIAGDEVIVVTQSMSEGTINRLDVENSLLVTDTLFISANQYIYPQTINKLNCEGSWDLADTLFIGSAGQVWQNTTNGLAVNNSFTAADTVFGGVLSADSAAVNRIHVTDTLQGVVLYASDGTLYRLRVSPTGVLSAVAVP